MTLYKYYLVYMDNVKTLDLTDITTLLNEGLDMAKDYYKRIRLYYTTNKDIKAEIVEKYLSFNNCHVKVFLKCDKQLIINGRLKSSKLIYHNLIYNGFQFRTPNKRRA